jgi:hypothetical protein
LRTYGLEVVANADAARPSVERPADPIPSALQFVDRHGLFIAGIAAALLVAFGWYYVTMQSKLERLHMLEARTDPVEQKDRRNRQAETEARMGSNAARVTGLVKCKWPEGANEPKFGDWLQPGYQLRLEEGLVQLTFGSGAKVVVEGPSDFVISAPGQATLEVGKIAAVVPRSGRGYTILTPTAEVVDLGTEFGVEVDDTGSSEVHVFEGDVVARPRSDTPVKAKLIHAKEDEAIQFRAATVEGQRMAADAHKFVRRINADRPTEDLPPLPVTRDLVLWLAADMIPEMQIDSPVATWPDILIGDNRYPDDAWQFDERRCPTWLRDERGLPAVKFDGWSTYLATSPMATGNQVTAFVVFAASPMNFASNEHGGMLLKFDYGSPSLEYALMPDQSLKARVWSGLKVGYVGELHSKPVDSLTPCATTYSFDAANSRSELFVNGKSTGVSTTPTPLQQIARKYIGAHPEPQWRAYFQGNIYEVILFDAALDAAERNLVHQYLSKRFNIPLIDEN